MLTRSCMLCSSAKSLGRAQSLRHAAGLNDFLKRLRVLLQLLEAILALTGQQHSRCLARFESR